MVTRLSDYQVNVDMPDSLYASEEVLRVDSLAVAQDSSFVRLADKVPLSAREQAAYATIDSTMKFEQAFQPTGFLARFFGGGGNGAGQRERGRSVNGTDRGAGGVVALVRTDRTEARFAV